MLVFLGPLMLSNVLQSLSQTANSVYLGRLLGLRSLAAVSAIFPLLFLLVSFLIGLGSGASVLIGQAFGARDLAKVKTIAGTTLALAIILGALVGAIGAAFAEPLLRLLATPADVLPISLSYARVTFALMPLLFVYLTYTTFVRGVGDTRMPLIVLVLSTALTFGLTPLFILGWLGLPALETNGAAVANGVSTAIATGALLWLLARERSPLAFDRAMLREVRIRPALALAIARIGVPTSLNLVMVSLSEIAVLAFVNRFGSTALAAYGAVNQIASYVQFPAVSIAITASIFGAQAIGAGRKERLGPIVRSAVVLNYVIEGILIVTVYFFSTDIVSLFITSQETIRVAHALIKITLWSYALFGNARVLSGIMVSTGTVIWPTAISIFSIWGVEVPVAYVLMNRLGLDGVWYGYPAAYATGLVLQLGYYYLVWKRKPITRLI